MKRTILLSLLVLGMFCKTTSFAQSVPVAKKLPKLDLGIKLGANFAQIDGPTWENSYKPGIIGGATIGLRKHKIGVQAEFLLNTSHYTSKDLYDSLNKGDFRALYLDIPVLFEYRIIGGKLLPKVWLMAGPQFSSLMSVKSLNSFSGDAKSEFKSGSFAGVLGAELRYLKFTAGVRYVLGLTDINNASQSGVSDSWKNHSVQLYLGLRFI